jgi:hypothetical protein
MTIVQEPTLKEISFRILKTPEEYRAINIASEEIETEKGSSQKELITKLVSKLKKQRDGEEECKVFFLNTENKIIMSRLFKKYKYSRFKKS